MQAVMSLAISHLAASPLFLPGAGEEVPSITRMDDADEVGLDVGNHPQLIFTAVGVLPAVFLCPPCCHSHAACRSVVLLALIPP